ncbi:MAG: hypothetical protein IKI30_04620 [Oxalobacter sp.]|nr:hypothetical protein [Oxalobacter sp.]
MKKLFLAGFIAAGLLLTGCQSTWHKDQVQDNTINNMTVGQVQKEIRVGMSGAEVTEVLGSPNIVTTDENRREVWVYDKIATDQVYSNSTGGVAALFLGFGNNAGGASGAGQSLSSGAASTSQRTLTVIIKYDEAGKVRDFAYHQSKF